MEKKKGIKNILWGVLSQVLTIGVGLIIPRLVLTNLGSEANGLLSSIGNILTYMSLLEAGVGVASVQALYKPIAEKNSEKINQIISATNYYYRKTGRIYLLFILLLSAGYTLLVKTEIPKLYVLLIILMSGVSGVLNYYFQGKYKVILSAEGKNYVTTNITTILGITTSLVKAAVLIAGGNVVAVQSIYFVVNLIQMLVFVLYMKKHYAWINYHDTPDLDAISQKNAVLVHQISGIVFTNTDVLVLTVLTTLKQVSVYSMYAMIFGMVKAIVTVFTESFVYALGQSFHNKPRFFRIFDAYETYCLAISGALFCLLNVLILPFLRLYTAGVTDANYLDPYLPWLFTTFYLMHHGRAPSAHVINIAQKFEATKWRSILESVINVTSSVILTYFFGIYGVLFGTIIALLYRTNDIIIYSSKIMQRSPLITYRRWLTNVVLLFAISIICSKLPIHADTYPKLILYGVMLCVTVIPAFFAVNSIFEPKVAKYVFGVVKRMVSEKLKRREKT